LAKWFYFAITVVRNENLDRFIKNAKNFKNIYKGSLINIQYEKLFPGPIMVICYVSAFSQYRFTLNIKSKTLSISKYTNPCGKIININLVIDKRKNDL